MSLGLWPTAQDYARLCVLGEYNSISKARSLLLVPGGRIFRLGSLCSIKQLGVR